MNTPAKIIFSLIIIAIVIWLIAASRPTTPQTVRVGVAIPLSGNRADVGEYVKNALTLAAEKIDATSGHARLDFLFEDTKYEATAAVSAVKKLIDLDKVGYIIGPGGSSEALAVAPVAEQNKTILIIPGAQTDELSKAGDYIFRTIYNTSQEVPVFGPFVASKMKGGTIHFLALNTAISDPYIKQITPILEANGKRVGLVEKFDPKDANFVAQLTKIKAQNPTDIFLIAVPKQAGIIMKEAHDLGMNVQFYNIGVESAEIFTAAGNLADGLYYPYSFDGKTGSPEQVAFFTEYVRRFGTEPDTVSANAYDAALMLSTCIYKNGSDTEKVKDCLYATQEYAGASGTFSIDTNGDALKTIFIKTIKNGEFVRYEH